jgi:hypothetical protein
MPPKDLSYCSHYAFCHNACMFLHLIVIYRVGCVRNLPVTPRPSSSIVNPAAQVALSLSKFAVALPTRSSGLLVAAFPSVSRRADISSGSLPPSHWPDKAIPSGVASADFVSWTSRGNVSARTPVIFLLKTGGGLMFLTDDCQTPTSCRAVTYNETLSPTGTTIEGAKTTLPWIETSVSVVARPVSAWRNVDTRLY